MPRRNVFDYVPPEQRSGRARFIAFAIAATLIVGGAAAAAVAAIAFEAPLSPVVLRAAPAAVLGGVALWRWLREDPRRR